MYVSKTIRQLIMDVRRGKRSSIKAEINGDEGISAKHVHEVHPRKEPIIKINAICMRHHRPQRQLGIRKRMKRRGVVSMNDEENDWDSMRIEGNSIDGRC